jgi:deoxycytidine triphosphate deaminase
MNNHDNIPLILILNEIIKQLYSDSNQIRQIYRLRSTKHYRSQFRKLTNIGIHSLLTLL